METSNLLQNELNSLESVSQYYSNAECITSLLRDKACIALCSYVGFIVTFLIALYFFQTFPLRSRFGIYWSNLPGLLSPSKL